MNDFLLGVDSHAVEKKQVENLIKKSESRKEPSAAFQVSLNKIEELEETRSESFEKIRSKTETLKSANLFSDVNLFDTELKKRYKSWEPLSRDDSLINIKSVPNEKIKREVDKKLFEIRECRCWQRARSSSACSSDAFEGEARKPRTHVKWYSSDAQRKCKSNPDFSSTTFQECKKIFDRESGLLKVMRSLKLLGFNLSDFGIFSRTAETTPKGKREPKSPTFTTKITKRSVSLDSLRMTVKRAWIDDCLDKSHRRLLAQAAYEEWYFKKEKELWKKREKERITRMAERENLRNDSQRKKKKSEEEFQKWLQRKRVKRKDKKSLVRKQENPFNRLVKTKEESEKAFKDWKKMKNRELEKMKKEKQKEEAKRIESEKMKIEKKVIAEKAFHQWKTKLEKTERLAQTEVQRKKKEKDEGRKKKEERQQISFQTWKTAKDEQMKEEIKKIREANIRTRKERQMKLEERIYEAQQAFEDWLEKTDLRKQKKYSGVHADSQKIIPWIPA